MPLLPIGPRTVKVVAIVVAVVAFVLPFVPGVRPEPVQGVLPLPR